MPTRFVAMSIGMFSLVLWAILANLIASLVSKELPVSMWPFLSMVLVCLCCVLGAWLDNKGSENKPDGGA